MEAKFLKANNTYSCRCLIYSLFYLKNTIEIGCFAICALASGILYSRIIRVLRQSKSTSRGNKIANAFIFMWFSWIICVIPFLGVDLYASWLMDSSTDFSLFGRMQEAPDFFEEKVLTTLNGFGGNDYSLWTKQTQVAYGLHFAATSVKHSCGFINSIVLIAILHPFRTPVTRMYDKIKNLLWKQPMGNVEWTLWKAEPKDCKKIKLKRNL